MISLERQDGRLLRIGHRGAAALAPENTLTSFRAAVEAGVDLIEFDVIGGSDGALLVAHSLAEMQAETPTLEDVLQFFVEEAPAVGVHVDLKRFGRERDVVDLLRRLGLVERSFVSSVYVRTARRFAALDGPRTGITIPRAVLGISDDGRGAHVARFGLGALRVAAPYLVRPLLAVTRASVVVMHHSIVTQSSVRAAHARGAAVVTWTVDDPDELARVDQAGVDAVVTNDPRIFAPRSVSTIRA
ncbi:MAG TPA: glycerophosphodiester phosphodiesterase [Gaiellaceae bacterium]|nr:glycerophosphodiester phosphodiesterase [Gaiellaceae bacterium]